VSTFADDETLELLRTRYIPFAPSVTELIKARDPAGDFFRRVSDQRAEPKHTKQGYYVCSPDGTLLKGWMYPRPDDGTMKRYLKEVLEAYQAPKQVEPLDASKADRHANPQPPPGAVVVEVFAKLIEAQWRDTNVARLSMIRDAIGRDRLWITKAEVQEILRNSMPDSLAERMIRFHLVDNTRGVPSSWRRGDLKEWQVKMTRENGRLELEGSVHLEEAEDRRYDAKLLGTIETKGEAITRFDLLVRGVHSAKKTHVGELPIGDTNLAVAFALSAPGESSRVPPLYSYDLGSYLKVDNLRVTELRCPPK
jgi:hypothetical protein